MRKLFLLILLVIGICWLWNRFSSEPGNGAQHPSGASSRAGPQASATQNVLTVTQTSDGILTVNCAHGAIQTANPVESVALYFLLAPAGGGVLDATIASAGGTFSLVGRKRRDTSAFEVFAFGEVHHQGQFVGYYYRIADNKNAIFRVSGSYSFDLNDSIVQKLDLQRFGRKARLSAAFAAVTEREERFVQFITDISWIEFDLRP